MERNEGEGVRCFVIKPGVENSRLEKDLGIEFSEEGNWAREEKGRIIATIVDESSFKPGRRYLLIRKSDVFFCKKCESLRYLVEVAWDKV